MESFLEWRCVLSGISSCAPVKLLPPASLEAEKA